MVFAEEESLTITTYYPSPYGNYNELSTNKLAVGWNVSTEQPSQKGDIRLNPWTQIPSTQAGKAGEIAIGSDYGLYVYNGTNWKKQGGGVCAEGYKEIRNETDKSDKYGDWLENCVTDTCDSDNYKDYTCLANEERECVDSSGNCVKNGNCCNHHRNVSCYNISEYTITCKKQ